MSDNIGETCSVKNLNPNNQLIYVGCNEDDVLHGERLANIVGYAMRAMGVQQFVVGDPEQAYRQYCKSFECKLKNGEPSIKVIKTLNEDSKNVMKKVHDLTK